MKKELSGIKIFMGLGNPEDGYKNTYHNAGKLMADYVSQKLSGDKGVFRKKTSSGNFESRTAGKVTVVKPLNYMNENGRAAAAALKAFRTKADSLIVAHDDSDIPVGEYKLSFGRGSAGHNGVKSLMESLGGADFWRLRIGVRSTAGTAARKKAGDFVLKKITAADKKLIDSAFAGAFSEIFGE